MKKKIKAKVKIRDNSPQVQCKKTKRIKILIIKIKKFNKKIKNKNLFKCLSMTIDKVLKKMVDKIKVKVMLILCKDPILLRKNVTRVYFSYI